MSTTINHELVDDDVQAIDRLCRSFERIKNELSEVIVGQESVVENLVISLFARGHALLRGVPGLAKTLLVSRLAETLSLDFSRIQFTPDLMPMDITGTDILQDTAEGRRQFEFVKGPLFANIILADEINRAPAKTQSAMLEAMQERRVTVVGRSFELDSPFFVLATQNPVEQEGTYPLPEAQLDRFMFLIDVGYPNRSEEVEIVRRTTGESQPKLSPVISGQEVIEFQSLVRRMPVPDYVFQFAVDLVRRTRPDEPESAAWLNEWVSWGAGPRAGQYLILGARARAALNGRYIAQREDVLAVAKPVLAHRVMTTFAAESEGIGGKEVVDRLINEAQDVH